MFNTLLAMLLLAASVAIAVPAAARQLHQVHPSGVVKMHMAHGGRAHATHRPG